jgi:Xaa-Pro aminopeptidase
MLVLLTILLTLLAASAIIYFFNRRNFEKQLGFENSGFIPETTNLRPLFEPTEEELLAEEREVEKKLIVNERQASEEAGRKRARAFRTRLNAWRMSPNKTEIADLLEAASVDGEMFADAAETIASELQNSKIEGVSTDDLAQMLESYFWLVPAEKRTPGVSYRFQTILRSLRPAPVSQ